MYPRFPNSFNEPWRGRTSGADCRWEPQAQFPGAPCSSQQQQRGAYRSRGPRRNSRSSSWGGRSGAFNDAGGRHTYCHPCQWNCQSKESYDEHVQSHVKCPEDTCRFEAQEEIVQFHYRIQHLTDFDEQVKHLDTPEEIEKWRSERRKNFPTTRRVEQKEAEMAERSARGELLQTQQFGKFKRGRERGNRGNKRGRGMGRQQLNRSQQVDHQPAQSRNRQFQRRRRKRPRRAFNHANVYDAESSENETVHPIWGLKKFEGIASKDEMEEEEGEITDSDSDINRTANEPRDVKCDAPGALQLLSQCYQSSSDEGEEEKVTVEAPKQSQTSEKTVVNRVPKMPKSTQRCDQLQKRFTLLEMLLAPEIRHERNMILQCLRFIISNNFFDDTSGAVDRHS